MKASSPLKTELIEISTDYHLPKKFQNLATASLRTDMKMKELEKIKADGFKDELQKMANGIFTPNYYLENYADDIDLYNSGKISLRELKSRVGPYVESRKRSARTYLKEQKLKSGRRLTASEKLKEAIVRGAGGMIAGAGAGGIIGGLIRKGKGRLGMGIGAAALGLEGIRQGVMKRRHPVYTTSQYQKDIKAIRQASQVTRKTMKEWIDPTSTAFEKTSGKLIEKIRQRRYERREFRDPRSTSRGPRTSLGALFTLSKFK